MQFNSNHIISCESRRAAPIFEPTLILYDILLPSARTGGWPSLNESGVILLYSLTKALLFRQWIDELLPKLISFFDNYFAPAIY